MRTSEIRSGPASIPVENGISSGVLYVRNCAEKSRSADAWRKNETPIALISGAMRGALRRGR